LVRQTNIVWVAFVTALCVSHHLKYYIENKQGVHIKPEHMRSLKYLMVCKNLNVYLYYVTQFPFLALERIMTSEIIAL